MTRDIIYMIVDTPLHAGAGADVGPVDLPIQREVHSDLPRVQGPGVKGAIKAACRLIKMDPEMLDKLFGPDKPPTGAEARNYHAGCLIFSDARLLLFPARVIGSMFAWFTCPYVIQRWIRDGGGAGFQNKDVPRGTVRARKNATFIYEDGETKRIAIGDIAYKTDEDDGVEELSKTMADMLYHGNNHMNEKMKGSLVLMNDDDFANLTRTKTEVVTRVRLEENRKTVARGALWTEEALPAETVLYSVVGAVKPRKKNEKANDDDPLKTITENLPSSIQFGGNETVGYGMVRVSWGKEKKQS